MANTDWENRSIINLTVKPEALTNETFVYYVALLFSVMGSAYGEIIVNGTSIALGGGDTTGDVIRKCNEALYPPPVPISQSR